MSELKPCPFCGSDYLDAGGGFVTCKTCTAQGPYDDDGPEWNRRAPTQADALLREAREALVPAMTYMVDVGLLSRIDAYLREKKE